MQSIPKPVRPGGIAPLRQALPFLGSAEPILGSACPAEARLPLRRSGANRCDALPNLGFAEPIPSPANHRPSRAKRSIAFARRSIAAPTPLPASRCLPAGCLACATGRIPPGPSAVATDRWRWLPLTLAVRSKPDPLHCPTVLRSTDAMISPAVPVRRGSRSQAVALLAYAKPSHWCALRAADMPAIPAPSATPHASPLPVRTLLWPLRCHPSLRRGHPMGSLAVAQPSDALAWPSCPLPGPSWPFPDRCRLLRCGAAALRNDGLQSVARAPHRHAIRRQPDTTRPKAPPL